jgi:hypothetical protein
MLWREAALMASKRSLSMIAAADQRSTQTMSAFTSLTTAMIHPRGWRGVNVR